ncbi:hypothetical protein RB594_000841 [Gaeumannomyces avenae]
MFSIGGLSRASTQAARRVTKVACVPVAAAIANTSRRRTLSSTAAPPPFPTVDQCPSPTCPCAATPELPDGLEIDHTSPLNGVMTAYHQHVLVCTGRDDWPSRIEEDHSGDNLAADLRELFGRGGRYSDPYHNISVLNSSFPSSPLPGRADVESTSAYLLPSFKHVPFLPRVSFDHVDALARAYLLPERLHPAHDAEPPVHRDRLVRQPAYRTALRGVADVRDVLVLACGHGGRDPRCGVYGPVLRAEFERALPRLGVRVLHGPVRMPEADDGGGGDGAEKELPAAGDAERGDVHCTARVGLISHIGGHKFAGNVIVYLPPGLRDDRGEPHALAGHGIWYGRVEPRHVEGIISETIRKGVVIKELFRGGITQDSKILRL